MLQDLRRLYSLRTSKISRKVIPPSHPLHPSPNSISQVVELPTLRLSMAYSLKVLNSFYTPEASKQPHIKCLLASSLSLVMPSLTVPLCRLSTLTKWPSWPTQPFTQQPNSPLSPYLRVLNLSMPPQKKACTKVVLKPARRLQNTKFQQKTTTFLPKTALFIQKTSKHYTSIPQAKRAIPTLYPER